MALSSAASAAPGVASNRADFNHMTTGYPLTGAHAVAVCETCHVGGVFKGTPRECDGCHAVGRRVVATPKSTAHIVTTAACDTCHFNTASFLGARFNHGTAKPGQCTNCHNGRLSRSRAAGHNAGLKATESCDKCHRTYAWVPATWNHTGVGTCDGSGCHVQFSNQYFRNPTTHATTGMLTYACTDCHGYFAWSPGKYKHNTAAECSSCHNGAIVMTENRKPPDHGAAAIKGINPCGDCHTIRGWRPAAYRHNSPDPCSSCHNGTKARGKGTTHGYTTAECSTCHTGTTTWLGASYHNGPTAGICGTCHNGANGVKGTVNDPNGTHIPLTAGGNPNCDLCHTSTTSFATYTMRHTGITTCNTCHLTGSAYVVTTKRQIGPSHNGSTAGQDCSACHMSTSTWSGALGAKPSNHIPYTSGTACNSCHDKAMSGAALHAYVSSTCKTCHDSNSTSYLGVSGKKRLGSHEGSNTNQDCISSGCHARRFTGW